MNSPSSPEIFVARQPIFRRNKEVFAYELLFRSGLDNFFDPSQDGEAATSKVITNSFLLIGIPRMTNGKKVFINFTEEMLLKGYPALFPKETTVVEVLENIAASPAIAKACASLARAGYVLTLDDFLYEDRLLPLIKLAKIIKFDIRQMSLSELARQVEIVKRYQVKLLAEKIETDEEFMRCKEMGFDLFQGYFFSRPSIISGRDIPGSKLHYLQVLRMLQDENCDFNKLAALLSHDVSLAYKLLRYVNSSYFARVRELHSVEKAVVMLGEDNLRNWLSLMMLSYLADDKPPELLRLTVLRGSFCKMIAGGLPDGQKGRSQYHMIGMFSLLPAILDKPMPEVLQDIPLPREIKDALLGQEENNFLKVLRLATAYERGRWDGVEKASKALSLHPANLPLFYDRALLEQQAFFGAD